MCKTVGGSVFSLLTYTDLLLRRASPLLVLDTVSSQRFQLLYSCRFGSISAHSRPDPTFLCVCLCVCPSFNSLVGPVRTRCQAMLNMVPPWHFSCFPQTDPLLPSCHMHAHTHLYLGSHARGIMAPFVPSPPLLYAPLPFDLFLSTYRPLPL